LQQKSSFNLYLTNDVKIGSEFYILKLRWNKFILFKDNENKIAQLHVSLYQNFLKKRFIQFVLFAGRKKHDTVCQKRFTPSV
jgi:hypothetical protein